MNDKDWLNEQPEEPVPWDNGIYQTGRTRPPKSHSGLIAFLLVCVIFLGGISSAMGLLNIHLFQRINSLTKEDTPPISFSQTDLDIPVATDPLQIDDDTTSPTGELTMKISRSPSSQENIPQTGGLSLQQIYQQVIPSVVSVSCPGSTGTGVVLSANGYIVTNWHVVENAKTIRVLFSDQQVLEATVVGRDSVSDLAVLHVQASSLTPAEFGDSGALRVGDAVAAIGDPLGLELRGTMTNGIVSAINRNITTGGRTMTLIQTNAALNPGNSGGPLINCYGQVVGINTMKIGDYVDDAGVEGLGFAIPSTTVKEVVDQLVRQGYVSGRPTLGLSGSEVTTLYQLYYHLPQGIYITDVNADSDAAAKGISPGDILVNFDGVRITDSSTLKSLLYAHSVGDQVEVVIYRSGHQFAMTLTVGEAQK